VGVNLGWHNPSGTLTPDGAKASSCLCQPRLAPTRGGSYGASKPPGNCLGWVPTLVGTIHPAPSPQMGQRPLPVCANQGWHLPGAGHAMNPSHPGIALGGCQPWLAQSIRHPHPRLGKGLFLFVPTKVGTYQGRVMRGIQATRELPWVGANLGWHNPSGTLTPDWAKASSCLCQPRLAPTNSRPPQQPVSSALRPLPTCSASTWPRSSGPHHPAPG
jgi:hypothetical protein